MKIILRNTVAVFVTAGLGVAMIGCAINSDPSAEPPQTVADGQWQDRTDSGWAEILKLYPDAVRPDIQLVRYVSLNESPKAWEACMHESGYPDVKAADGKFSDGVVPDSKRQDFDITMFVCTSEYAVKK